MSNDSFTYSYRDARNNNELNTLGVNTTKWEWFTCIHRDTYALHIGNNSHLTYYATIKNVPELLLRNEFLSSMVLPCGLPE